MRRKVFIGFVILIILVGVVVYLTIFRPNPNPPSLSRNMQEQSSSSTKTYEQIEVLIENLEVPWGIAFLPDGRMLVTERPGRVQLVNENEIIEIGSMSEVKTTGESGLHGITVDPDFTSNNFVYLYYTYSSNGSDTLNKVVRFRLENNSLVEDQILIDKIPGAIFHDGGRIKFGPDGYLYITTGDARQPSLAQDKNSLAGKILRLTRDGGVPFDNPFGNPVYSYGHRNPQGIAWDSAGQLWETEHGPSGTWPDCCQDEVNMIVKGGNYGWPDSVGEKVLSGTMGPVIQSNRDIWAPASLAYMNGKFYFTGLRPVTLYSFDPTSPAETLQKHFEGEYGRLRDAVFYEGGLFFSTSNRDGRGVPGATDDRIIRIDEAYFN